MGSHTAGRLQALQHDDVWVQYHYHAERNHQGLDNALIARVPAVISRKMVRRNRDT